MILLAMLTPIWDVRCFGPLLDFEEWTRNDGCWWVLPRGKIILVLVPD